MALTLAGNGVRWSVPTGIPVPRAGIPVPARTNDEMQPAPPPVTTQEALEHERHIHNHLKSQHPRHVPG
eukprot:3425730-Prymnesium_polylepis.1